MTVYFIKARKRGERSFWFLGDRGSMTRKRIHAIRFEAAHVEKSLAILRDDNPDYEFKAVEIAAIAKATG